MLTQDMAQNSFIQDAINHEAIKVELTATITTAFLEMASYQKLLTPSFKSYVNNISLCEAYFLKLKFSLAKNFLSSLSTPSFRL